MDESSYVATWLYGALSGDVTIAGLASVVSEDPAPQGSAYPVLVFSLISAIDVQVHNAIRIMVDSLWDIKAVDQNASYSRARSIMNRVDTILHRASGTVTDAVVYSAVREQIFRFTEIDDGKPYRHLGGQYRIHVQYTGA